MAERSGKTWLIVGASRGIGHEFARQLLNRGDDVVVTVRQPSKVHSVAFWTDAGIDSSCCTALECDVLSEKSIDKCIAEFAKIQGLRLDNVVINAGVLKYPNRSILYASQHRTDDWLPTRGSSYDDFAHHLHTNTIGPIIFAQRLLKTPIPVGTITFISSDSGSAAAFRDFEDGFAAYSASKAALNQMARHMAAELKRQGCQTAILLLHPGEVKTDMANIEVEWEVEGQMEVGESVAACITTMESKGLADSGTFWTWKGEVSGQAVPCGKLPSLT
ncbi:hypothetical protein LTR53_007803 [Teratosphaeriaceae sp. CCFEE 6253]|nr:hypothetical protein LTR53_007803 [Teratosphaeriaceae sp. CCFEE 6253]